MAETALSVAMSILGSAIAKATTAGAEEMSLLMGVKDEIWFMKDELKAMQAFLVTVEAMKKNKAQLKARVEQVRGLFYDIEDCLDELMVHIRSRSLSQQLMMLKDRYRIAIQIRHLKSRVQEMGNRNIRYNIFQIEDTDIDEGQSSMEDVHKFSISNIGQAQLVDFDSPKQRLLQMIKTQDNNDGYARVICVVGMAGLGKTTLVRNIFDSKEGVMTKFSCCAWITMSPSFSKIQFLKDMISKLLGYDSLKRFLRELEGKRIQEEDLASYLREELKEKRYFVVLDNLLDINDWRWIREVSLPIGNIRKSMIIVITRNAYLAQMCTTNSLIYHLEPQKEEHAIRLLLMKIGKRREDIEMNEKLMVLVKQLVKKCGHVPLVIVTIGALFATKHELEWRRLYKQLPSELENNLSLEAIKSMVIVSYNHLPSHLKPCFLYLSIFPEDFEISRKRLVNRWIVEGLVKDRVGMTLEEVGESYFIELVNRCMIQPSRVNFVGTIKSGRVHDIMRDIIVSLSRDEGFVYTYGNNIHNSAEDTYRHVAYHISQFSTTTMDWGRVRSLTFFGTRPIEHSPPLCSPPLRMIRTLDLESADFDVTQKDMSNIVLLYHLKYLKIGNSNIYALPSSIEKLQGLQVLDIRHSYIASLPAGICKLQSLRILYCWSRTSGVEVPRGIGNLKQLQKLGHLDIKRTSSKAIKELWELSKLRTLRVSTYGATEKKCVTFCKAIWKLSSLSTLKIDASLDGTVDWLDSGFFLPPKLRNFTLRGQIRHKVDLFYAYTASES